MHTYFVHQRHITFIKSDCTDIYNVPVFLDIIMIFEDHVTLKTEDI